MEKKSLSKGILLLPLLFVILAGVACGGKVDEKPVIPTNTEVQPTMPAVTETEETAEIPVSTDGQPTMPAVTVTEESRSMRQGLEAYSQEECIAWLKEKGVEIPEGSEEDQALYRGFYYTEFQHVLNNLEYQPVFGRFDLMEYSIDIKLAILREIGTEEDIAKVKEDHPWYFRK